MSIPILAELKCPRCSSTHWVLGELQTEETPWADQIRTCPHCLQTGPDYPAERQSPPQLFLQPSLVHPLSRGEFEEWVDILRVHFPDHPQLGELGTTWFALESGSVAHQFVLARSVPALVGGTRPPVLPAGEAEPLPTDGHDGSGSHRAVVAHSIVEEREWLAGHYPGWVYLGQQLVFNATGPLDCLVIACPTETRRVYFAIKSFAGIQEKRALTPPPPEGPPCPYCSRPIRTARAKQCRWCGMDWHDPQNVFSRRGQSNGTE
jgi:hypothetical protein